MDPASIPPAVLECLQVDTAELRKSLDSSSDIDAIRGAYQKLEATTFSIAETLYGGDGSAQA